LLIGLYPSILENDNHLVLPNEFLEDYKEGFCVSRGFDRNVMVLTMDAFDAIYERAITLNLADPVVRLLLRMILSSAQLAEIDANGRIAIPEALKEYANLEQEVTIVGQGDYVELWSRSNWKLQEERLMNLEPDQFSTLHISTQ